MDSWWLFDKDHWLETSWRIAAVGVAAQCFAGFLFVVYLRELASKFRKTMEERRMELEQFALQNQTKLAQVHQERATAIREFDAIVWEVTSSLAALNSSSTNKENVDQKRSAFNKAYEELCGFYKHNRLAFPKETAKRVEELIGDLNQTALLAVSNVDGVQEGEKFERRLSEIPAAMTGIGNLSHALDDEFRGIIGGKADKE